MIRLQKITDRCYDILLDGRIVGDFCAIENWPAEDYWVFYQTEGLGLRHWELREVSEMLDQFPGFLEDRS